MAANTIFNDTFTEGSNTTLASHVPDTGTSWTVVQQYGAETLQVVATSDDVQPVDQAATKGAIYTADATYTSANYKVTANAKTVAGVGDDWLTLIARFQDTSNVYFADLSDNISGDPHIYKRVAGVNTTLATWDNSGSAPFTDGVNVTLEVVGSTITLYAGEIGYLYVEDSAISNAGKGGLGIGAHWVTTTGDTTPVSIWDNFSVVCLDSITATSWFSPTTTGETNNNFANPTNAYASDNTDTTEDAVGGKQDYGDFGITGPTGSDTIIGIQVKVEGDSDLGGAETVGIELSWDNGTTWTAQKTAIFDNLNTDNKYVYGLSTSTWGRTWAASELADTAFRIRVHYVTETAALRDIFIDQIQVRVLYESAGGAPTPVASKSFMTTNTKFWGG